MKMAVKWVLFATIASGGVAATMACSNNAIPQAIISANLQPATMGPNAGMCAANEQFMWVPGTAPLPSGPMCDAVGCVGPDTNNNSNVTVTGTSDFQIVTCSIVPQGTCPGMGCSYAVALSASLSGGSLPGTLTVEGTFTPRSRTNDDAGTPNMDNVAIPNITMEYTDATKQLLQHTCTAQYVYPDNGSPGTTSLPDVADTYADSNGGRIWISVYCNEAMNLLESQKPGNAGCEMSAVFRFENCSNKSSM